MLFSGIVSCSSRWCGCNGTTDTGWRCLSLFEVPKVVESFIGIGYMLPHCNFTIQDRNRCDAAIMVSDWTGKTTGASLGRRMEAKLLLLRPCFGHRRSHCLLVVYADSAAVVVGLTHCGYGVLVQFGVICSCCVVITVSLASYTGAARHVFLLATLEMGTTFVSTIVVRTGALSVASGLDA